MWTAYKTKDGYGQFRYKGQALEAHRLAFQWENGILEKGLVVDHAVCSNPPCVNPAHMKAVSTRENVLRGCHELYAKEQVIANGESVEAEARRLVSGDRQKAYSHPIEDFTATAKIWSGILGIDVTPNQVALCMVGVKLSRESRVHKRDNLVDAVGYVLTLDMVVEAQDAAVKYVPTPPGDYCATSDIPAHLRGLEPCSLHPCCQKHYCVCPR